MTTTAGKESPPLTRPGLRLPAGLLVLSLAGAWGLWFITFWGIGTFHDTFHYLFAARSLTEGRGLLTFDRDTVRPLTHFPPLLSLLLAGLSRFGLDFPEAGRWLNIGLFALNIFLTGWIGARMTQSGAWGLLAALFALLAPGLVHVHSFILSEPPYLACLLGGLYCLARYLTAPRGGWALASGVLLGLGFLARYIGGTLLVTAWLALFLWAPRPNRGKGLALVTLGAGVGILPLLVRNWLAAGTLTNRSAGFQWPGEAHFLELIYGLRYWFGLPVRQFPPAGLLWLMLGLTVLALFLLNRFRREFLEHWAARLSRLSPVSLVTLFFAFWGFATLAGWLLTEADPERWLVAWMPGGQGWKFGPALMVGFLVGATLGWGVMAWRQGAGRPRVDTPEEILAVNLLRLFTLHGLVYFLLLGISLTWFDHGTRLVLRILTPLQLVSLLVILGLIRRAWKLAVPGVWSLVHRWVAPLALAALLVAYAHYTWSWGDQSRNEGIVYFTRKVRQSPLIKTVRTLPRTARVYSNEPVMLSFLLNQPVEPVSRLTAERAGPRFVVDIRSFDLERRKYDLQALLRDWRVAPLHEDAMGRVLWVAPETSGPPEETVGGT